MGNVIRTILFSVLVGLSLIATAAPVNVVEIANFFCPECQAAQQHIDTVTKAIKATGGEYDFVPVFYGKVSSWPARVYLSLPKSLAKAGRIALFTAAQNGEAMVSAQAACIVVNDQLPHYSVDHCITAASSSQPAARLTKALQLLQHIYRDKQAVLLFPLFVIEQNGQIQAVLSRNEYPNITQLVNEVAGYVSSH